MSENENIASELNQASGWYWWFTLLFGCLFIGLYISVLSFNVRHTYQLPVTSPGVLVSDRWTWPFIREWIMCIYWLIPLSGLFMMMTRTKTGYKLHMFILFILFIWWVLLLLSDIRVLTRSKLPPNHVDFSSTNLARDNRWCCVYGGQPGTELVCCVNAMAVAACPPMGPNQLLWDGVFQMRFWLHAAIVLFLVFDFMATWLMYLPRLNRYYVELEGIKNK